LAGQFTEYAFPRFLYTSFLQIAFQLGCSFIFPLGEDFKGTWMSISDAIIILTYRTVYIFYVRIYPTLPIKKNLHQYYASR